jgi:ribosomal subunit interface protein
MELVLKARGIRITDQLRATVRRKLDKLSRLEPRTVRMEVEVISRHHPRPDGTKSVQGTLDTPRRTFRATAEGPEVEAALDRLVVRLERQVTEYRKKRRHSILSGAGRLKSARLGSDSSAEQ